MLLSAKRGRGGPSASPLPTPLNVHCFTFVTWQCSFHFRNTFKNVFEESYLGLTKSHAIDRLSLGDQPVDRDRLVGHPCSRVKVQTQLLLGQICVLHVEVCTALGQSALFPEGQFLVLLLEPPPQVTLHDVQGFHGSAAKVCGCCDQ